jgi:hypothetical protein
VVHAEHGMALKNGIAVAQHCWQLPSIFRAAREQDCPRGSPHGLRESTILEDPEQPRPTHGSSSCSSVQAMSSRSAIALLQILLRQAKRLFLCMEPNVRLRV